jgi:molybdenum cofactor cytidylyltransferase
LSEKRVAVVVLAAGSSTRLGQPKQLLEIGGQTLLRHTLETVLASLADFAVVTLAAGDEASRNALHGLDFRVASVENSQLGQSESVRAGLALAAPDCDAVLFVPCDLPLLSSAHLDYLITEYRTTGVPVIASKWNDVVGVPALFDQKVWPEFASLSGDEGARRIIRRYKSETVAVDFAGGAFDLDTPEDVTSFRNNYLSCEQQSNNKPVSAGFW